MNILYTDVDEKPYAKEINAKFVSLETLLRESDYVTLHPFLDEKSNHMIAEPQLKMMKKTSYLINVSRGPVIDEKALVKALKEVSSISFDIDSKGWIAGAGLDVYEKEPEFEPELAKLDSVVMVPHIGSATIETRTEVLFWEI